MVCQHLFLLYAFRLSFIWAYLLFVLLKENRQKSKVNSSLASKTSYTLYISLFVSISEQKLYIKCRKTSKPGLQRVTLNKNNSTKLLHEANPSELNI